MRRFIIFYILVCFTVATHAQRAKMSREDYIEEYKDLAIEEMIRSEVPASITLAQGLLESDNGNSSLAVKGNNHFGIKCHSSWTGKKMYHDDDEKHECFRKYISVQDSYADHSDFLVNGSRYDFLFELKIIDYKAWARGLKKAGYATSNKYANLLIKIIEENELFQYDVIGKNSDRHKKSRKINSRGVRGNMLNNNRIDYIIIEDGDSFESLREKYDLLRFEILKYNELTADSVLRQGQILYLQPKRNNAAHGNYSHVIKEGECLYDISQQYGVKLKKLYQKNHWNPGFEPDIGDIVLLRKGKIGNFKSRLPKQQKIKEEPELEQELEFEFDGGL